MSRRQWYSILLVVSLLVLTGTASSCATAASPKESPLPSTSTAPVVNYFTASPAIINAGEQATLNWDVSGAAAVTIEPAASSASLSSAKHGVEQVLPTSTSTYTLTATNEAGTTTRTATVTVKSADETLIGCDPVSGGNEEIDLRWEELCLSTQFQVQIAKDPDFTIIVLDTGVFTPASTTSVGAYYPAGGQTSPEAATSAAGAYYPAPPETATSALAAPAKLEAGHTYYWRARVRGNAWGGSVSSPWSEVKRLTIGSGLPASNPSYGPQLIYPNNACTGYEVKPAYFAWSPFKDITKYKFVLAKDAAMTQLVKETDVTTTAYEYDGQLEYGQSYFWRVKALEPAMSDWSATFSFQTQAPPPPTPSALQPETPLWAWVFIATGLALLIAIIVLTFRPRRR